MRDHHEPQVYVGSKFNRHCLRCVVMLVPIVGVKSRGFADHEARLELSVFLVIARYTYRNKSTLKFSALIRTIAAEATIYFLAMIAMQIYVQLALNLMEVCSSSFLAQVLDH